MLLDVLLLVIPVVAFHYHEVPVPTHGLFSRATRFRPALVVRHSCAREKFVGFWNCFCVDEVCGRTAAETNLGCRGPVHPARARVTRVLCRFLVQTTVDLKQLDAIFGFGDVLAPPDVPEYTLLPTARFSDYIGFYVEVRPAIKYLFPGDYFATAGLRNRTTRHFKYFNVMRVSVTEERTPCEPRLRVEGLGPCGLPAVLEDGKDLELGIWPEVEPTCDKVLTSFSKLQWLTIRPPSDVKCSGEFPPGDQPLGDSIGGCYTGRCNISYHVRVPRDCVRDSQPVKVIIRQMWHRKGSRLEVVYTGFVRTTTDQLRVRVAGLSPTVLSDAETLLLDGSASVNPYNPSEPLRFRWQCWQCPLDSPLGIAFSSVDFTRPVIRITDRLNYTDTSHVIEFRLQVSNALGAAATTSLKVRVPGRNDRDLFIICPCCEYTFVTGDDIHLEARPQRTEVWGTRYPNTTWTITKEDGTDAGIKFLTGEIGGMMVLVQRDYVPSGSYTFTASSAGISATQLVRIVKTNDLFETRGLRQLDDLPPVRGTCSAAVTKGVAVLTRFVVQCVNFVDHEQKTLLFEFYFCDLRRDEVERHTFRSLRQSCILMKSKADDPVYEGVLPEGRSDHNYEALVVVFAVDPNAQFAYTTVDIVVEPGTCSTIILKNVKQYEEDAIASSVLPGARPTVSEILSYIQSSSIMFKSDFYIECDRSTKGKVLQNETAVRDDFVQYLRVSPIESEGDLHKAAEVLGSILPTDPDKVTPNFTEATLDLLGKYADAYDNFTSDGSQWRTANKTTAIGEAIVETMTSVLNITVPPPSEPPLVVPDTYSKTPECVTAESIIENLGRMAEYVARVVDTEGQDVGISYEDYEVWIRETRRLGFLGSAEGTRVRLNSHVDAQTSIVFPASPFRCHNSDKFSNTQAVRIDAKFEAKSARWKRSATTLSETGMDTYLRRSSPIEYQENSTFETSLQNVSVHRIRNTEPGAYLRVELEPTDKNEEFVFAVVVNKTPVRRDFLEQNRYHVDHLVGNHDRWIRIQEAGLVMVAVLPLTDATADILKDPHRRPTTRENISFMYGLRSTLYVCMHWDFLSKSWTTGTCHVLKDSNQQFVHCECNHTSIFTAGLFVAPSPINFAELDILLRGMSSNLVMVAAIVVIWCVYIIVFIWAARMDGLDEGASGIEYLSENAADDAFGYLVSVYTWFRSGSGTSSRVLLKIVGEDSESREVVLRDAARNPLALQTGGRDWYFLSNTTALGAIETLVVTVELKGDRPAWRLSTIIVRDLQTTQRYVFIIDDVLHPDLYRGKSTFEFEQADDTVLEAPWRIFKFRIIRYFREEHLIISIFSRLPTGNFTRKQRASVALLLVISGMLVSLMFYGTEGDDEEAFRWTFLEGLVELPSWREVVIALQSTAIVTPFLFVVVFLFERSKQPAFRRKPAMPHVEITGSVREWVDEDVATTSKMTDTPRSPMAHSLLARSAREGMLPVWASALAWTLCIGGSALCSVFVILYGLTYGYHRSVSWVRCNMFNVILSEFLVQPIKLLIMSAVMAVILRTPIEMENIPLRFIE